MMLPPSNRRGNKKKKWKAREITEKFISAKGAVLRLIVICFQ